MKLRRQQIDSIVNKIAEESIKNMSIKFQDIDELKAVIRKSIIDDLIVEDRLNEEVHKILDEHSSQIRQGSIEYHKMFKLVKEKLARDRNIIL